MIKEQLFAIHVKKKTKEFLSLIIGISIFSFYAGVILPQNELATGGALGLSIAINKLTGISVGLSQLLLNTPLIYISWRYIGKKFTLISFFVIFISAYFIDLLPNYITGANLQDKLVSSIFAGILSGVALAFILIAGGSTGGTDITAKYLSNRFKFNIATIILIQDIFIYVVIWLAFDIRYVMYALIMSYTRSITIRGIQRLLSGYIQCTIITENPDKLVEVINTEMHRGSTIVEIEGGYSHEKKRMIILIIQQNEIHQLKRIINSTCPSAFITINNINTVMGNFKEHSYRL